MNTAIYTLRAMQLGLSIKDMDSLTMGDIMDIIVENSNDNYNYPQKAQQNDIDRMFK